MRTNPGGQLAPENVVGRSREVEYLWRVLEDQSVYIHAERRIGKTSVLTLLDSDVRQGWASKLRDLESVHTAEEFAARVYRDIEPFLRSRKRAQRRFAKAAGTLSGVEIAGVLKLPSGEPVPWKDVLEACARDLADAFDHNGDRLLLLWDEVPFMLGNIARRQDEEVAMEVLDTLRYLRQTYPCLRMVLTGSIGLHHVLTQLRRVGYANAPVNDMESFELQPLRPDDGTELARALLTGEQIDADDADQIAALVSSAVDHFPYYIHHLVRELQRRAQPVNAPAVDRALAELLIASSDPWELQHYRKRIKTYYGPDEAVVLAILDAIATGPRTHDEAFAIAKSVVATDDKEHVRDLLTAMQRDHYIRRGAGAHFDFSYGLIRRWWRLERGIEAEQGKP
ncbi:MAG: hypothetical protein OXT09_24675 [Myxococcales bacterium]|nr:hypothetical protein [Myxococcales bacterium]